jgi:predicted adenine nucleotide alpha hydrolase (AANH) superfamily ATPase
MENYNLQMEKELLSIKESGKKPKLLLHSCCAPCSSSCIERLIEHFSLTIYFYNPNMDSLEEYNKRAEEQVKLCSLLGVECIIEDYDKHSFFQCAKGYEKAPEGGARCINCFNLRLKKTAEFALENGYEYFTTTLTVSPLKDANKLNAIGQEIAQKLGVKWLPTDFKKKGGYQRSIELSKEYNLYRQNYCGCEFSKSAMSKNI